MASLADRLSALINHLPEPEEAVEVVAPGTARPLRRGEPFRVLTWNLQYAGTRRYRFFYDGGRDVRVAPEDVTWALDGFGATLAALAPDLALLQELDRDSARTGRVDQLRALLARAPYPRWAATPYHRSAFVPHPPGAPLGRIDLAMAVLSRFPLAAGLRLALPLLREPWLRQQFNLHRALLAVDVPRDDGPPLAVAVTHLSAFSRGDGTLPRQVERLAAWMDARRAAGQPFVLGGDLNLLPPDDDPRRLGADAVEFADDPPPLRALFARARSVIPAERLLEPGARTYLPPGADRPDRVLDYLFVSDEVEVRDARVVDVGPELSDHWPVLADLVLR